MSVTVKYKVRFGKPQRKPEPFPEPPVKAEDSTRPPVTRLARQLALAHHVERLVESGAIKNHAEAARALGVSRARMAQVMSLLNLSPTIQEVILHGDLNVGERWLRSAAREVLWQVQDEMRDEEEGRGKRSERGNHLEVNDGCAE